MILLSCDAKLSSNLFFQIRISSKKTITIRFVKPSFGRSGGGGQRSRTVRLEARIGELEQLKEQLLEQLLEQLKILCLGIFGLT